MGKRTLLGGITMAAFAGLLLGQDAWKLPACGAVEYSRRSEVSVSPVHKTAAATRRWQPDPSRDRPVPERYFAPAAPAPWLCAGELNERGQTVTGPVRDLRDLMRAVAFDLRAGGGRGKFGGVVPYGDLAVAGSWGRTRTDGTQELRAAIRGRRPQSKLLRAFCARGCTGKLVMTRRLDPGRGIVESFSGEIDLVIDEGPRRFRRVQVRDIWKFVAVRDNQDVDFRLRVADAIRRGAAFVSDAIAEDRTYLDGKIADRRSYGSGRLALGLLTLLHGNVAADDPVVVAGFRELARRRLVDTYSLAAALMALARLGVAPGRALSERERGVARRWCGKLLKNVDPRTDPAEVLRFNYVRAPRCDTSVQQYGLLGLAAAQQCGVEVEGSVFAAAARQLLAVQCPASGTRTHLVATYDDLAAAAPDEPRPRRERSSCRGFAYVNADEPPFGSMTSAGVSGLLLARAGMEAAGHRDRGLEREIDRAVRDGFGWLSRELSLRCNPGHAERGRFHWYYWLYCLERSCELASIARLAGRDWYYEGALQLMSRQQPGGAFRSGNASVLQIEATCFAILFLAKASAKAAVTRSGG